MLRLLEVAQRRLRIGRARSCDDGHPTAHRRREGVKQSIALRVGELFDLAGDARVHDRIRACGNDEFHDARERRRIGRAVGPERRGEHRAYAVDR